MAVYSSEIPVTYREEMNRFFRHNYLMLGLDGSFYLSGMAFIQPQTILPGMVEILHGPNWLIAMIPLIISIGYMLPQVFVTHRIERLPRMMPLLLTTGVFQRLPYLLVGLILVCFSTLTPRFALTMVVLAPLLMGLSGGTSLSAFSELVAKTIPANRLSSLWAIRYIFPAFIGIAAGSVVSVILTRWPGITGFGVLHLCAFAALAASYVSFAQIREPTLPPKRIDRDGTWIGFVGSIPAIVRADRRLGLYLLNRACAAGSLVLLPFLSVHALRTLGKPAGFLGILLIAQMIGMVAGNLLGGYFGDKRGVRLILIWSAVAYLGLCLWAPFARNSWEYPGLFGIMGLATSLEAIGVGTMSLELSPVQKRVAYMAIISIFGMAGMTFMTLGNIALQRAENIFIWQAIIAGVFIAASLFILVRIQEPRAQSC